MVLQKLFGIYFGDWVVISSFFSFQQNPQGQHVLKEPLYPHQPIVLTAFFRGGRIIKVSREASH